MLKVAVIVGSVRADSINRTFAEALGKLAKPGMQFDFLRIDDLPVHNPDSDADQPVAARKFKARIEAADGVLFVTPEYNRSIPAALKNAIDWASRPYGKNSFAGKPVAVAGASVGNIGTAVAQQHLRNILAHLDAAVLGQPEVFFTLRPGVIDETGNIVDEQAKTFLQGFLGRFQAWVSRFAVREAAAA
jgi:chromate reductase